MVILGIDPGTAITGYGVVRRDSPNRFSVLGYGAIITPSNQEMAGRLKTIYGEVCRLIEEFHPDCLAIEQLFFNTNVQRLLLWARPGVAILAGATADSHCRIYLFRLSRPLPATAERRKNR